MEFLIWLGIAFCALNAATFSGLNLAYFSVPFSRLRILAAQEDPAALKVLALRAEPNFLLSTILWANVSYNVLLALLANSVMAGVTSFLFSTVILTLVGEILPQATFSRKALKVGAFFAPMIRFYQLILYPIAKLSALGLDYFLGQENPRYYNEKDLIALIEAHMHPGGPLDISPEEGQGAIEFLKLDDRFVKDVGTLAEASQIFECKFTKNRLLKIKFEPVPSDAFIAHLLACDKEWMILTDLAGKPHLALDVACFIKAVFEHQKCINVRDYCVRPMVVTDPKEKVSTVLKHFMEPTENCNQISCSRGTKVVLYWHENTQKILTTDDLMALILKQA